LYFADGFCLQRFYFVNNEDLVEIIGNSNEPAKIVQHLSKMFAAMSNIDLQRPETESTPGGPQQVLMNALSMGSKEGEVVPFSNTIAVTSQVKEWLGILEREMSVTLAILLDKAQSSIPANDEEVLKWMDTFPCQIIILASQVMWTSSIEHALGSVSDTAAALQGALAVL
jgi:dynein heavy chain 1